MSYHAGGFLTNIVTSEFLYIRNIMYIQWFFQSYDNLGHLLKDILKRGALLWKANIVSVVTLQIPNVNVK